MYHYMARDYCRISAASYHGQDVLPPTGLFLGTDLSLRRLTEETMASKGSKEAVLVVNRGSVTVQPVMVSKVEVH